MSRTGGDIGYCSSCDRYFCRECNGGCACERDLDRSKLPKCQCGCGAVEGYCYYDRKS